MPKRVLIVDDNRHIRLLAGTVVRGAGYEVLEAENGVEALKRAMEERPDMMVLDVVMPELDGFETLRFLRKREETATLPVVMCTTEMTPADRQRGIELGANGYLGKPFTSQTLLAEVRRLVGEA